MYCLCVSVYCRRVSTQLQLTNISISNVLVCWLDGTGYYLMEDASQFRSDVNQHMKLNTVINCQFTKAKICFRFCGQRNFLSSIYLSFLSKVKLVISRKCVVNDLKTAWNKAVVESY
jgi:hypothetical protein